MSHLSLLQASAYIGADSSLDAGSDPVANIILPGGEGDGNNNSGNGGSSGAAAGAGARGSSSSSSKGGDTPVLPVVPFEACVNMLSADEVRLGLFGGGTGCSVCVCVVCACYGWRVGVAKCVLRIQL